MYVEVRADNSVHITGYVNAVERESRPIVTKWGRVNECIESGVFERALAESRQDIPMTVDHQAGRVIATTADGSLRLSEDHIGLKADAVTSDPQVVEAARNGKIRGWSFGMTHVEDSVEERENKLPLRRILKMVLDHVTLVIEKVPCYCATSVEVRSEGETEVEERSAMDGICVKQPIDYGPWEKRLQKVKGEETWNI